MANATNLKLLSGQFSPFVIRVRIALNIKSLQYENIEENFNPKSELLLQSNPVYKKIPVLLHGDKPICESRIIVEYIDEVWNSAPSLLLEDAYDRAMTRFLAAYIDDKCTVAMEKSLFEDEEARKPYLEEVEEALVTMEGELQKRCREGGKGFFGGDEIGLVDITFGSLVCWLRVVEALNGRRKIIVETKHPYLMKWAERFESDPNVKDLIPENEKLIEYATAIQMKLKAASASASAK